MPAKSLSQWGKRPPTGSVTGQQLKKRDPERYNSLVKALRHGIGRETVVDIFGTSMELVAAVLTVEKIDPKSDKQILNKLQTAQDLAATALTEAIRSGELKASGLPVALGILTDKVAQIQGRPSQIVENRSISITANSLNDLVEQAKSSSKSSLVVDAEVVADKS